MAVFFVFSSHLLILLMNCCFGAAASRTPRSAQDGTMLESPPDPVSDSVDHDMASQHMFKLYEKYNRELNCPREGNTVRSFKASQESANQRVVYQLNLTSLQDSEDIQSATFHFLFDRRPRQRAWFCKRFKTPSCRSLHFHPLPSIRLLLRSSPSGSGVNPGPMGSLLGNVTFHPLKRGVWQIKDVTGVIKEAREKGHLLVSVEMDFGQQYQRQPEEVLSAANLPYLLLYANDQALAEPNSVAATLQRYEPDPSPLAGEDNSHPSHLLPKPNSSPEERVRREALLDPIQNNELPEVDYRPDGYRKEDVWMTTYLALKPKTKTGRKERRGKGQERGEGGRDGGSEGGRDGKNESQVLREGGSKSQVLHVNERTVKKSSDKGSRSHQNSDERGGERMDGGRDGGKSQSQSPILSFDQRTMRKARRRQWGLEAQQISCSRRSLRVDFADIGWSEWVLAPKAFDAYYCAGTCGFPMPKVLRPSNHATIQSIVRAVGIVPGVPEPCCVPERMSPLGVLFQDEGRNLVLKVYPSMSVETCTCR